LHSKLQYISELGSGGTIAPALQIVIGTSASKHTVIGKRIHVTKLPLEEQRLPVKAAKNTGLSRKNVFFCEKTGLMFFSFFFRPFFPGDVRSR
jgi:hypothetical protein